MTTERNAPCPCGSGKKYKKCCLAKDEASARSAATAAARAAEEERQAKEAAREADWGRQRQAWSMPGASEPTADSTPAAKSAAREPAWPPLTEADQQLVDAWWREVGPVYTGPKGLEKCGWLLEQTLVFLDQQPRLFRYLHLYDEFLFELGGALARAERMDDYLALLRRLRDEQPETYFQCFGYYDEDLLTEALRTGQRQEISLCLGLFRQHPVKHIDEFAKVVNLLAWRGCEVELRELLEPTARIIADSPDVLGGDFGLLWLTNLAIFRFLEAGDASAEGMERFWQVTSAIGWLDESESSNRDWLGRILRMASRPNAEVSLDLKDAKNEEFHDDVGWSFTGWAHRTKGLTWSSARFLSIALLDYWAWREQRTKPASQFGLNATRLDHYLAQCCRNFISFDGVRALSTLQAFHYFTEYLLAHDYFSGADAARLQAVAAGFYQTVRRAVDACDSAYRICPTYEALINPQLC